MKTTPVTPADLRASVIAVPPMPRHADLSPDFDANRRLLAHLRAGGVTTYMYGGNANFYNLGVAEFGRVVDGIAPLLDAGDWLIPAVGPDFGKAAEQVDLARERAFPTVMVLPLRFPATPRGVASGLGRLAARYGKPVIAYVKDEGYVANAELAALVRDGAVCAIKYAIVRENPAVDVVLEDLVQRVGPDLLISGIGERPVIDHFRTFGLRAFTSGSTCVAPALSDAIRRALQAGDHAGAAAIRELFIPLEDARDAYSPIRILHSAVQLAGIAETGPIGDFLSLIDDPKVLAQLAPIARTLLEHNQVALVSA